MKRRFVVGIDGETSTDVSTFLDFIHQQGLGWWHWFDNFWLLTTYDDAMTTETIRDKLVDISDGKNIIVIEVKSINWYNFGPQGEQSTVGGMTNISKWFEDVWDKP